MQICFLSPVQRAAPAHKGASVSSLLKPPAVNQPWCTRKNLTFLVTDKHTAVLCLDRPTIRFLWVRLFTNVHTQNTPPPLLCHVEENLALRNILFWRTKWWQPNEKIWNEAASYPTLSVFFFHFNTLNQLKSCFFCCCLKNLHNHI